MKISWMNKYIAELKRVHSVLLFIAAIVSFLFGILTLRSRYVNYSQSQSSLQLEVLSYWKT
jgi:hypothetical protein